MDQSTAGRIDTLLIAEIANRRDFGLRAKSVRFAADVTRAADLNEAVSRLSKCFAPPTILVNSAVFARYAPLSEIDEDVLDRMCAVGIKGVLLACRAVLPCMRAAGGGSIVNLSSVVSLRGIGYSSGYAALKGGVDAITRAQSAELGPESIRVNAVSPSAIPSPMSRRNLDELGWQERRRRVPLGFNGSEEDVASAVLFFAGTDANFMLIARTDALAKNGFLSQTIQVSVGEPPEHSLLREARRPS